MTLEPIFKNSMSIVWKPQLWSPKRMLRVNSYIVLKTWLVWIGGSRLLGSTRCQEDSHQLGVHMLPQLVSQKTTGCTSDWPCALRIKMCRPGHTGRLPTGNRIPSPSPFSLLWKNAFMCSHHCGWWDHSNPSVERSGSKSTRLFSTLFLGPTSATEVPPLVTPLMSSSIKWVDKVLFCLPFLTLTYTHAP